MGIQYQLPLTHGYAIAGVVVHSYSALLFADLVVDDEVPDDITSRARFLLALAQARAQSLAEGVPIASTVVELWRDRKTRRGPAKGPDDKPRNRDPLDLPQASNYLSFFEDRALAFQWALAARDV